MQDKGHISDLEDTDNAHIPKPGTGGSNEGTGNILGVPDESTVISRASSEGTGSKTGVPDEEKLILEWEADVDSEHFDRDDNAGDDNEETKPDPEEIYKTYAFFDDSWIHQFRTRANLNSEPVPTATVVNAPIVSTNTSVSTTIAQDAPSTSHSLSSSQVHPPVFPQGVAAGPTIEDTSITQADLHPSVNPIAGEPSSAQSTSRDVSLAEPNQVTQPPDHLRRWTKDHPLDNIVGNPSRPVSTRKQLASDALWCCFHTELSKVEPKNFKMNRCSIARIEASRIFIANGANQEYEHLPDGVKTAFSEWDLQEEVPLSTLRI
ncbi:hypothetical protein Tco_0704870 [Tanacetum coccineum]|uniref:Uncharacterized protein n=1 Tax=Tanacetum coccineum TaxID=301880 RepID=A0ABQ4Y324_9ASTR